MFLSRSNYFTFILFLLIFLLSYSYPYQRTQLDYNEPIPSTSFFVNNYYQSLLKNDKIDKIKLNLLILFNSFSIITLPFPDVDRNNITKCSNGLLYDQHSIEVRYPFLLAKLSNLSLKYYPTRNEKDIFFLNSFIYQDYEKLFLNSHREYIKKKDTLNKLNNQNNNNIKNNRLRKHFDNKFLSNDNDYINRKLLLRDIENELKDEEEIYDEDNNEIKLELNNRKLENEIDDEDIVKVKKKIRIYNRKSYNLLTALLTKDNSIYSVPLFKYLDFRFYSSAYCTESGYIENFANSVNYTLEVEKFLGTSDIPNDVPTLPSSNHIKLSNILSTPPYRFPPLSTSFYTNFGHDLIIPSTHPFTYSLNYQAKRKQFTSATFLHNDFDISGDIKKDIIIPYYARSSQYYSYLDDEESNTVKTLEEKVFRILVEKKMIFEYQNKSISLNYYDYNDNKLDYQIENNINSSSSKSNKNYLFLFSFLGGNRPFNGYRYFFELALKRYMEVPRLVEVKDEDKDTMQDDFQKLRDFDDIKRKLQEKKDHIIKHNSKFYKIIPKHENFFYSATFTVPHSIYLYIFSKSEFCLFFPGDTSSSSRLFLLLSLNCIPVIIHDNLILPYENYIDYSKCVIRFPQEIIYNLEMFFDILKSYTDEEKNKKRKYISDLYSFLYFPDQNEEQMFTLNPVSLSLVEYIEKKLDYCESIHNSINLNRFCNILLRRKKIAEEFLPLIDA